MKIKPKVDPKSFEVGVIVGRFQTNSLHKGHNDLVDFVFENHKKVIILIGVSKLPDTQKNPLDFASRKLMIQSQYPSAMILPIADKESDEDWSNDVDSIISIPYGDKSSVIYGSRDSFIPYYSGRYDVIELEPSETYNATNIRIEIARETLDSKDFRSGVIYSTFNKLPEVKPFVSVAVQDFEGNILFIKGKNDKQFYLPCSFVGVDDSSFESACKRTINTLTSSNLNIKNLRYINSSKINHWRYDRENSIVMNNLFMADYNFGISKSSLSDYETKWISIKSLKDDLSNIKEVNKEIVKELINRIYLENKLNNI